MIERVRREDTWHREARDGYPDPLKVMRVQFKVVEELRDTHSYEELELCQEDGDPERLLRVLTALRANLVRQERYEEALPVAEQELTVARQLAVPGDYSTEVANSASYWVTDSPPSTPAATSGSSAGPVPSPPRSEGWPGTSERGAARKRRPSTSQLTYRCGKPSRHSAYECSGQA